MTTRSRRKLLRISSSVLGTAAASSAVPRTTVGMSGGALREFSSATPMSAITVPEFVNVPHSFVVLAVILMSIGGFAGATWVRRNEKIVLYSEGGIHSAQAWLLLGGLDIRPDKEMCPNLPAETNAQEHAAFKRTVYVKRLFGDTPRKGVQEGSAKPSPPQTVTPSTEKPKKRKEGC